MANLVHAGGTNATAQEVYDAFMNTRVLIVKGKNTYEAINMVWYDNNSEQADPTNVGYARLYYVTYDDSSGTMYFQSSVVGDTSLVPN